MTTIHTRAKRAWPPLWPLLCGVLLLASCAPRGGVSPDAHPKARAVVNALGAAYAARPEIAGLSLAVLRKGEETPICAAFGSACLENAVPMTPETRCKIGSVTKVYTAALIHRLMEEGRLAPHTPLSRFFPDFPYGGIITVQHLLEHTSGLADMLQLAPVRADLTRAFSAEEIMRMAGKEPLAFAPGTRQAYCNTGYVILALLTEKITGQTYAAQVRKMFVEGLGMRGLVVGEDAAVTPRLACGYTRLNGQFRLPLAASISVALGTGDLVATPADVVRLVNLDRMLQKDVFATLPLAPLVLPDGQEALSPVQEEGYSTSELDGCTFFRFTDPPLEVLGKLGLFPGFGTVYMYDRQTRCAVAVSVNNEKATPLAVALAVDVLRALRRAQ
ncbi:serine hydrolase domain-containing protein [Desulfovibrio legallii]|uniref:CubicO group peptidase, beta-lactamase class C family n=1 Tax=Desulfovibrio legallii TaxID=571438 RepID=A0A1G7JH85_9BACT|nr:serine hydrolase domain-containing protein [Desulfovibrio legallii]SDF24297.1 CubicO group peptidase, beta-lactamase class C family [Desulfovibrio legallii]